MRKQISYKRRYKLLPIGTILLVIVVLTAVLFLHMSEQGKNVQAAAVTKGVAVNNEMPSENGVKGTATNPFVILEIVPYDGYAEIGYLIDGCEPVDISKALNDDFSINTIGSFQGAVVSGSKPYTYKNKNLFLKDVLHLSDAQIPNYQIVVKTMQSDELNKHPEWIDRADLIYINPKTHMQTLVGIWGNYNKLGKHPVTNYATSFYYNDISWETAVAIFKKVVVAKDYAGIIIDATSYDSAGPSSFYKSVTSYQFGKDTNGKETTYPNDTMQGNINNVYKLCLMLRTMNPVIFYNLYLNDNGGTVTPLISQTTVNGATTGCYKRQPNQDAQIYWTHQTFLPTKTDGTKAFYNDWLNMWGSYQCNPNMYGNVSIMNHIYTYNGDNSLTIEFSTGQIYNDGKFTKELFDYIAGNGYPPTPATAVNYILHYRTENKSSITVLDLEPCSKFTLSVQDIRELLLTFSGDINLVHQSTSEFNGKIEDLNSKYDLIYLGLDYGAFNIADGHTVYNDNTLNGKIYLHVGDLITSRPDSDSASAKWNIPGATSNKLRLPGNDITKLRQEALNDYINAGYPVIAANQFFSGTGVNTYLIDPNSNINHFITEQNAKTNFFTGSSAKSKSQILSDCVSLIKPEINLISKPVLYNVSTDADPSDIANPDYYINGSNSTNRDISFQFQIHDGTQDRQYTAKIYIDANADGKFAAEEEQCHDTFLSGNHTNTITKTLDQSYFGIIPWKLSVYQTAKPAIRTEVTGYSAVMKKNEDKQTLRILQINQNDYNDSNAYRSSRLNLQNDTIFQNYTKYLNDFKVDFTTISIKDFEKLYNHIANEISNLKISDTITVDYNKSIPSTDRLAAYDMVILGFSDYYDDISNTMALNNLADYIKSGKSVLCTHDNTSFNNTLDSTEYTPPGYNFNLKFRDILGMDRFGIRTGSALVKDDAAKDYYSYSEKYLHGYTYYAAMRLLNQSPGYRAYQDINSALMSKHYGTTQVNKLNDGQLTSYPYKISNTFTCGETHAQYYQLNLEDPDIVVWYTLGSSDIDSDHMYSVSPYDASNNYYIYNKGNITYSGMGHSAITSPYDVKKDEIKLFVNTFIASYKASLKQPSITVKDVIRTNDNTYMKYLNLDPNETTFDADEFEKIEFIVNDYNLLSSNFLTDDLGTSVTLEDGSPLKIYSASDNLEVTDRIAKVTDSTKSLTKLKNNNSYYILYPMSYFGSSVSKEITIYTENCKGLNTSATVQFVRRTFFDLD